MAWKLPFCLWRRLAALAFSECCVWEGFIGVHSKKISVKGSVPPEEKVEVSQLWAGQSLDGEGLFSVDEKGWKKDGKGWKDEKTKKVW